MSNKFNLEKDTWDIIKLYFQDKKVLINHHIESFDDFMDKKVGAIVKQFNPLSIYNTYDAEQNTYLNEIELNLGMYIMPIQLLMKMTDQLN